MVKQKRAVLYSQVTTDPDPLPELQAYSRRRRYAIISEVLDSPRSPRLKKLLREKSKSYDIIIAPSLALFSPNLNDLIKVLGSSGVEVYFLKEGFTVTASTRNFCQMLIEMKKDLRKKKMSEIQKYKSWLRTKGIQVHVGRERRITTEIESRAIELLKTHSTREVSKIIGIGKTSVHRMKKMRS